MRLYRGDTPLNSIYVRRRAWFKEICWDLVGIAMALIGFWVLVILMFVM